MTKRGKNLMGAGDLRKIINESIKRAIIYKHNLELAKTYWEKATMAANEYADIEKDDPRCKEKDDIIVQKFELNVEERSKRRQEREKDHEEKKALRTAKELKELELDALEKAKRKTLWIEERAKKEELERKDREAKKAKYLEKRKEVLNLIESRLDEIKNISHLITVRQIKKMLLDNGDIESYRTSKVLHSAARKAVIWYNSMLAIKGGEKEIDDAADLYTLKRVIDFLKREDFCECDYYYVGSEKCYTLDWRA